MLAMAHNPSPFQALHGYAEVAASLPRTSRKKRAFPLMSGGAASSGGVLFPPCMRHRRSACATSRGEAPRTPSVSFCIVKGSVLPFGDAPCVCCNGRENRGRGRPVSAAHAASGLASLRSCS
jgi:hypothetical protein